MFLIVSLSTDSGRNNRGWWLYSDSDNEKVEQFYQHWLKAQQDSQAQSAQAQDSSIVSQPDANDSSSSSSASASPTAGAAQDPNTSNITASSGSKSDEDEEGDGSSEEEEEEEKEEKEDDERYCLYVGPTPYVLDFAQMCQYPENRPNARRNIQRSVKAGITRRKSVRGQGS